MEKICLEALLQNWKQISFCYNRYKKNITTQVFQEWVTQLQRKDSLLRLETIGITACGNHIFAFYIGCGPVRLQISAGMHANESINTNLLMAFIEKLLQVLTSKNHKQFHTFFRHFTLVFTPLVNPDGVNLLHAPEMLPSEIYHNALHINNYQMDFSKWKANAFGVDINNQFPAKWQKISSLPGKCRYPAPSDFPGYSPLTENESIAMYRLLSRENFDSILCLHTQGEEFYWGFMDREPANGKVFSELYQAVTGYKSIRTLESYGGLKDWFILQYGRLGITVEVGIGVNPLPLSDFEPLIEKIDQILFGYLFFYV